MDEFITTELDRVKLKSKDEYSLYFNIITHALQSLLGSHTAFHKADMFNDKELQLLTAYFTLLLNSVAAFRLKYRYDEEHQLVIDVSDSGFPNYQEFRYLYNDVGMQQEMLQKLPPLTAIKDKMLAYLLDRKEAVPASMMHQASLAQYYSTLKQDDLFQRFIPSKLLPSPMPAYQYLLSWGFYDVILNRPFICMMYFDYVGKDIEKDKGEILETVRESGDRWVPLVGFASEINRKLQYMRVKYMKQVDIGPLYSVFSKDNNPVTHAMLQSIKDRHIPYYSFALQVSINTLEHIGEYVDDSAGFFGKKRTVQQYLVPSTASTQRNGSTYCHTYLLAPHRVVQALTEIQPDYIKSLATGPVIVSPLEEESIINKNTKL